jgi:hypothetical protein
MTQDGPPRASIADAVIFSSAPLVSRTPVASPPQHCNG